MHYHLELAYPLSNHTMISHFRSHDLDPTLYLMVHKMFQIITITLTTQNILDIEVFMKNPFTLTFNHLIFYSLYTESLFQYHAPKQHLEPIVFLDKIK